MSKAVFYWALLMARQLSTASASSRPVITVRVITRWALGAERVMTRAKMTGMRCWTQGVGVRGGRGGGRGVQPQPQPVIPPCRVVVMSSAYLARSVYCLSRQCACCINARQYLMQTGPAPCW